MIFFFYRWDMSVNSQEGIKTMGDFEWHIPVATQDIETR